MGNQICCQETAPQEFIKDQQLVYNSTGSNFSGEEKEPIANDNLNQYLEIKSQRLSPEIQAVLNEHSKDLFKIEEPFQDQFNEQDQIKLQLYGNDLYEGPIDIVMNLLNIQINRPCKIGKMYKQNGAYFIGNFVSGKAEGPCFYIMSDGSFYRGFMKDNHADCQDGQFISKDYEYVGGFKNNSFHGKGTEKSPSSHYSFTGTYEEGKKKQGVMKWWSNAHEYIYEGYLDSNGKFTGKGKLNDPQGRYEGEFLNGEKHGYGIYYYKTQLRYEGFYSHNKKEGEGKLFNNDNTIAYKGVFKNGMPNGKGIATSKNGTEFQTEWIDGIDSRLL